MPGRIVNASQSGDITFAINMDLDDVSIKLAISHNKI